VYRDADVEGIFMCEDQGCVLRSAGGGYLLWHARFSVERLTGEHDWVGASLRFSNSINFLDYTITIGF
jgi:hypothetical protein